VKKTKKKILNGKMVSKLFGILLNGQTHGGSRLSKIDFIRAMDVQ
jgi:hypothetical protein